VKSDIEKESGQEQNTIIIAVMGDLHGHFSLVYRILKRWEIENQRCIDVILQVGDMGIYPDPSKADKATRRFAQKDHDELSFIKYFEGSDEAEDILGPDSKKEFEISANMYFIKGNHEDFDFLSSYEDDTAPGPVDYYGKMLYMASGNVYEIEVGRIMLRVGSLGGIACNGKYGPDSRHKWYSNREVKRLLASGDKVDILLTHDAPYNTILQDSGSKDILEFIGLYVPTFHFCGHYHVEGSQLDIEGDTMSYILNEVNFKTSKRLNPGCIGILEWNPDNPTFRILDERWMEEFTRYNWRSLRFHTND